MKIYKLVSLAIFTLITLSSCTAVGTVFEAGKWYGMIIAVIIIGIFYFLFGRGKK